MAKKKIKNFGLCACTRLKLLHIFVPNLGEIFYQFGHKIAFSVKLRPIYGHARPLLLHILDIAQQFGTFAGLEIEIN